MKRQYLNTFSEDGARLLAQAIRTFWLKRGFRPAVWVEPFNHGKEVLYQVRSNMIGGRPLDSATAL